MMRLARHRDEYRVLLSRFAEGIVQLAGKTPLSPIAELPPIDALPNAFLAAPRDRQPSLESQLVFFSVPAQSNFGKPLADVIAEVTRELDVTTTYTRSTEIAGLAEKTARTNDIFLIVADRQSGSLANYFRSTAYTDDSLVAHCALIVINPEGIALPLEKPPKGIGFFSGDVRSESAFRDALRTGIIKIQNALLAKANIDEGPVSSGPTPSLPSTS
jgi:hypothetical protein